ncbi:hypothetical protein FNH13_18055 [Ornithinimicrobium ciconiae]|uniref:Uncharacterized protein n=1 Tax=Ornithinimicrobium ciconiae TaxID=2594265 RepID=A0A516GEN3_9MICO|nr:hypothetical protein [Ornithinimicrobium ciconiae]QDO89989.1 hypothetical protein FNH13_18055 [Ornithinimicrobium ciconiae]
MPIPTPSGLPYLEVMRATYEDLQRWKVRAADTEPPLRGSKMYIDDAVFPRHPISEVARTSLMLSGEHLRLARDAFEAGQLYPSAHFTVLRGALVGAAQGVWVLSPEDREERRERGLTVLTEMHTQMSKHYKRLEKLSLSETERQELRAQQSWLATRVEEVAAVRSGKAALNLTDTVIPEALDHVFPDAARRESGRTLWTLMSGDAHVLGWSTATRGQMGLTNRASGLAEGSVRGSFADIAQPFMAAHRLLRAGWSLFDRRCDHP